MTCSIHFVIMLNLVNVYLASPLLCMCPHVLCISKFFIPTATKCVIDGEIYNAGDPVPNDDPCLQW